MTAGRRRSLSHVGGHVDVGGSRPEGLAMASALDVEPARDGADEDRAHVHGFHTYPARMHPETARSLIESFAARGATVLDPFCGSGTVLVEAMVAGHPAMGTDLNPIAVRLATTKTRPHGAAELASLVASARQVAELANERRLTRAGATRRLPPDDVAAFDPHVLLELDGLRAGIERLPRAPLRDDLFMVFSAILVKLSRRRADTSAAVEPRRIAAGYPSKLLVRKTEELARGLSAFEALLPEPRPRVRVGEDDATRLDTVAENSIDLAITSPPYAGTYDYVGHHALRMRWLGLNPSPLEHGEIGARRRYASLEPSRAKREWIDEVGRLLRSLERVLRRGAAAVLLLGDSAVGRVALRANDTVLEAARATRMDCVARASQARPHFHEGTAAAFRRFPRCEHALMLRKR